MKLKLDDAGNVVVQDGKPVYVYDDGKEIPFDAAGTVATISRLNGEAKGHRERAERAETTLKTFEGIADPTAALAALETVKNIDGKKLIDAGKVDEVKAEAKRAFDDQVRAMAEAHKPVIAERDQLRNDLHNERVGNAFSRSKFIADKIAVPVDMVQSTFGSGFKIEDGKIIGYQGDNKVFSRTRPGEVADFDEALEIMVDGYAHRDSILKGTGGGGGAGGGGKNGAKTMNRADFDQLAVNDPAAAAKFMGEVRAKTAELVG